MQIKDSALFKQDCFINGQWFANQKGKTDVFNPASAEKLGSIPNLEQAEVQMAVQAAAEALSSWRKKTANERAVLLKRWHELIVQHTEDLAILLTLEQGKTLAEARNEILYGASFIEWFAEEAKRVYGDIIPAPQPNQRILVIKQPIGVVGAITPWNFPNAMITRKCAPALAAGCTVVVKPSELTPFSAFALAELAQRAGIPAGVFNVITGDAKMIGEEFTTNPQIRKISFTGSTRVGKLLMAQSAPTLKKLSLELGGNAPFIVFDDADIDAAITGILASKFRNSGQTCVCANRILVQASIYDELTEKLTTAVKALKVGNGLMADTQQGPLINEAAVIKVERHIADAVGKGAKLILGGRRHSLGGSFFEPTILTEVTPAMQIAHEETFGPVAPLFRFKDEADAIALSNATDYGLASYFYSRNLSRVWHVAEALEYGMVGVNSGLISNEVSPFGGIKHSGVGREGSKYGIEDYLEIKYVSMTI